ncbi:MAG: hypothetical protein ACTSPB_02270 [Candidatus Thorarchaeota archaeon]
MNRIERNFVKEKETPGTFRYREVSENEPVAIGSIYLKKWVTGGTPPEKIKVVVEEA